MKTITATEASRRFSDLLDAIERGERVVITRGGAAVAEIGPVARATGSDLVRALRDIPPPNPEFGEVIEETLALLVSGEDSWGDA